jgi:hypothetical protein
LRDWTLIRNVVFEHAAELDGAVASQRPTLRHRLTFRGGLPLPAAGAYLAGRAPDLWVPVLPEQSNETPRLDGTPLTAGVEEIRLADVLDGSDCGRHVVEWAGATRAFMTVESMRRMPPCDGTPAHALAIDERCSPTRRRLRHPMATSGFEGLSSKVSASLGVRRPSWSIGKREKLGCSVRKLGRSLRSPHLRHRIG